MKCKSYQVTDVRDLPVETEHMAPNGDIRQTAEPSPRKIVEGARFTIVDHLGVQQQSERRAHELWCAGGCRPDTALSDWVQAEREVLEKFRENYVRRHSLPRWSRSKSSPSFTRRKPEPQILKHGRTSAARDRQTTSESEKTCQVSATFPR